MVDFDKFGDAAETWLDAFIKKHPRTATIIFGVIGVVVGVLLPW